MTECKRCGRCCYSLVDGKPVKCKHLVKLKNGKTLCRIYHRRLGATTYKDKTHHFVCFNRDEVPYNYKDCPFNKEGQEFREVGY